MENENNKTKRDLTMLSNGLATSDSEYVRLVSLISDTWENAKGKAALAVNTELLEANWQTGRYIVEFEQHGNAKARYGEQLLTNLSRDLTKLRGKGYSRSNLFNMRLFYVRFPKIQTVSGQLTWSHYLGARKDELLMEYALQGIDNQLFAARYQLSFKRSRSQL